MSKAIFTAEQLETLLSRVLATAIDKFDACLDKMMDKFEARLANVYDELSMANRRIDKLEQTLKQQDYDRDYPAILGMWILNYSMPYSMTLVQLFHPILAYLSYSML